MQEQAQPGPGRLVAEPVLRRQRVQGRLASARLLAAGGQNGDKFFTFSVPPQGAKEAL